MLCVWHLLLINSLWRFFHGVSCICILFLFSSAQYSIVWICPNLFIHLSVDRHMYYFHCGAMLCAVLSCFSRVRLFAILWTVACQAPLSMGFLQASVLEWVAMPSSGDLTNPGMVPASLVSPSLAGGSFTTSTTWEF